MRKTLKTIAYIIAGMILAAGYICLYYIGSIQYVEQLNR
jgi:hypothetical protein